MKDLLNWLERHKSFPYSNFVWTQLLGAKKKWLIAHNILCFEQGATVNEIFWDGEDFNVEFIDGKWYAIGEDREIELSPKDVLKLELNKRGFAEEIAHLLGNSTVSESPYSDGIFLLGTLATKTEFRVFLAFNGYKALSAISEWCGRDKPIVIALNGVGGDMQDFVSRHQGECISFEDCFTLCTNGFEVSGKLKKILELPKVKKSKDGYYSWKALVGSEPEFKTLAKLSIDFLNASEVLINFGGSSMRVRFDDVSIFRNDTTKEMNENWKILYHLAVKRPYVKIIAEESRRVAIKRFNKDFREFFNLPKSESALSIINGNTSANFQLKSEDNQSRSRSEVFYKVGDALPQEDEFQYTEESD